MTSISVGIPSGGTIRAETFISYVKALIFLGNKNIAVNTGVQISNHIDDNRNNIVLQSLKYDISHIMMIDTDLIFPEDGIYRLIQRDKDIVGGNYNSRMLPLSQERSRSTVKMFGKDNIPIAIDKVPMNLFKCHSVPGGFMLIKRTVFEKLTYPYFASYQGKETYFTEDVDFGNKCFEVGIDIWCDPTIVIGHIGQYLY